MNEMANLVNNAMDLLHDQSLPTIELLQTSFPNNKNFMISISTLFDPRYVFLVYAPLLFALNKRVGQRMVIALTLTEWANQILKWLLAGERPYWYAEERAEAATNASLAASGTGIESYDAALLLAAPNAPKLKQFPVTCELGAGSPSGHAMVTATVWYILIHAYLAGELPVAARANYAAPLAKRARLAADKLRQLSWSVYTLMLVLVSLSRVYLACHFPHQCVCGALLGVAVARLVCEKLPMHRLRRRHFALATCFMFASALATFGLLRALGLNPLWSVDKGMRWCAKKEYIHLDTTPFFSMMRYLGFALGAGLAYDARKIVASSLRKPQVASSAHLLLQRALVTLVSIVFGQLLLALPWPRHNLNLFYLISFLSYTLFAFAIAAPIPELVKRGVASVTATRKSQ